MDAVRLGVPLIVSTHDPELTARLAGEPWTRLFAAGDPDALAKALDQLTADVPARPGTSARGALDMSSAADQAAFLTDTYARLTKESR
ncbi:hypothetical protein [Streptomyces globisporus]